MGKIPQAFIDDALENVKCQFFNDLNQGNETDVYNYCSIAAQIVLLNYLNRVNSESCLADGHRTSLKDIYSAFRKKGMKTFWSGDELSALLGSFIITFDEVSTDEVSTDEVSTNEFIFKVLPLEDSDGHFYNYMALVRLIYRSQKDILSLQNDIQPYIDCLYNTYRQSQVFLSGISSMIEDGMEDVPFNYGCKITDGCPNILVWLYDIHDGGFSPRCQMTIPYWALQDSPGYVKDSIRILSGDFSRTDEYPQWIQGGQVSPNSPLYSEQKNAGVF